MIRICSLAAAMAFALTGVGAHAQQAAEASPAATPAQSYQYDQAQGKSLYENTCMACHGATGAGVPGTFPPLKANPVVLDPDPTQQIKSVLFGLHGPIKVNGQEYNGFMPPFGDGLSDTDIANLINYERSSWGNDGKHMTPDQAAALRAAGS